jgi:cardiolipin synthase
MKRARPLFPGPSHRVPALAAAGAVVIGSVYAAQDIQYRREAGITFRLDDRPAPGSPAFSRLVESWCGAPVRAGNRVEVLRNGDEIFPTMLAAIAGATRTIDLSTYIFWRGDISSTVGAALAERAADGVAVRILVDGWGSVAMDRDLVKRLEQAGATFVWFRTPHVANIHKFNNRSHRRVMVVDGTVGFTGGLGIADEWTGNAERPGNWRETHVKIEGPAVRDLLGAFADNWVEETGEILAGPHIPELAAGDDAGAIVQVSRSSARQGRSAAEALAFAAILCAQQRLWFTTAYFAPRRALVAALVDAAGRGVDVRVLVNGPHIDKSVVRRVGQRSYETLLAGGVRVFEYQRTMMHAKVMLADVEWANVGTANFDNRSLALQDEINCSVLDSVVGATVEKHFAEDFDASREISAGAWRQRPLRSQVRELAAETLRHSL